MAAAGNFPFDGQGLDGIEKICHKQILRGLQLSDIPGVSRQFYLYYINLEVILLVITLSSLRCSRLKTDSILI